MISCRRPGVPIKIVGGEDFSELMSLATVDVPPMRRFDDSTDTNSGGRTSRKPRRTE